MSNDVGLLPQEITSIYREISSLSTTAIVYSSKPAAVLNVLHLIILTRKSMRTSSINAIMIGIAICDLICSHVIIVMSATASSPWGTDCVPPHSINRMYFNLFYVSLYTASRQCSAWLGLLVALLRYLIVSDMTNQSSRVSTTKYGVRVCLLTLIVTLFFFALHFFKNQIVQNGEWTPRSSCQGVSLTREPIWKEQYHWILEINNGLIERVMHFVVGMLGKIIPCAILPVITVLLLRQIKQAEQRTTVSINDFQRLSRKSKNDRTTFLVIFIATTFMLSEFPVGVTEIAQVIIQGSSGIQNVVLATTYVCEAIFICNASIHCLIHFAMSSRYRKTAVNLIPCWRKFKIQKQSVIMDPARSGSMII